MPARVLICGMPRLLRDAVTAIFDLARDVVVVARLDGGADVATVVSALQPDVVVLQESGAPGLGSHDALSHDSPHFPSAQISRRFAGIP